VHYHYGCSKAQVNESNVKKIVGIRTLNLTF